MRVFLSSTAVDLAKYREVAVDTLLRLRNSLDAMEYFGARPGTPVAECERMAAEADIVVCIVAHRYGYEPEPGSGSITKREVEAAHSARKPIFAWIADDTSAQNFAGRQEFAKVRTIASDSVEAKNFKRTAAALSAFKLWLRENMIVDSFTTPDDLGRKIAIALSNYVANGQSLANARHSSLGKPELRIVHALQPARHFCGRVQDVQALLDWMTDIRAGNRIYALVAAGGTGKTAIIEKVLTTLQQQGRWPGMGNTIVWSFDEKPDTDAFLQECCQLFIGENGDKPAGGRLERLQRGLDDGRCHMIVLDGLETIQSGNTIDRVHGQLEDHNLRLFLKRIAAGLGRTRALVTSRFPLIDLVDYRNGGYIESSLADLSRADALQVMRSWGVLGSDTQLAKVAGEVGCHALSVDVISSYLCNFANYAIEGAAKFSLDLARDDDPKAAKLSRILRFYAEELPSDERDLLARLAIFPRGANLEWLGTIAEAGGNVAGAILGARQRLPYLLDRLERRGLIYSYADRAGIRAWTAHPFLCEQFSRMLGCEPESIFLEVAGQLIGELTKLPGNEVTLFRRVLRYISHTLFRHTRKRPTSRSELDLWERLVEYFCLAKRFELAFETYQYIFSDYLWLGNELGEYIRGCRMLEYFSPLHGDYENFAPGLDARRRCIGLMDLSLFTAAVGRPMDALIIREVDDKLRQQLGDRGLTGSGLAETGQLQLILGRGDEAETSFAAAMENFKKVHESEGEMSLESIFQLDHRRDQYLMKFATCRFIERVRLKLYSDTYVVSATEFENLQMIDDLELNKYGFGQIQALRARIAISANQDPSPYLVELRAWTSRSGDYPSIVESHMLHASQALRVGDLDAAKFEAEAGLLISLSCGYLLSTCELSIMLSDIYLGWSQPKMAMVSLDLAWMTIVKIKLGPRELIVKTVEATVKAYGALGKPKRVKHYSKLLVQLQKIADGKVTKDNLSIDNTLRELVSLELNRQTMGQ